MKMSDVYTEMSSLPRLLCQLLHTIHILVTPVRSRLQYFA